MFIRAIGCRNNLFTGVLKYVVFLAFFFSIRSGSASFPEHAELATEPAIQLLDNGQIVTSTGVKFSSCQCGKPVWNQYDYYPTYKDCSDNKIIITALNRSMELDETYGDKGNITLDMMPCSRKAPLATSNNDLYVLGHVYDSSNKARAHLAVTKLSSNGKIDTRFATQGQSILSFPAQVRNGYYLGNKFEVFDDKLITYGDSYSYSWLPFEATLFINNLHTGLPESIQPGFSEYHSFGDGYPAALDVRKSGIWGVVNYRSDKIGAFHLAFPGFTAYGNSQGLGLAYPGIPGNEDRAFAQLVQDDRVLVLGRSGEGPYVDGINSLALFAIDRHTGQLDSHFAEAGVYTANIFNGYSYAIDLVSLDGNIYILAKAKPIGEQWNLILLGLNSEGIPLSGFGPSGSHYRVVESNFNSRDGALLFLSGKHLYVIVEKGNLILSRDRWALIPSDRNQQAGVTEAYIQAGSGQSTPSVDGLQNSSGTDHLVSEINRPEQPDDDFLRPFDSHLSFLVIEGSGMEAATEAFTTTNTEPATATSKPAESLVTTCPEISNGMLELNPVTLELGADTGNTILCDNVRLIALGDVSADAPRHTDSSAGASVNPALNQDSLLVQSHVSIEIPTPPERSEETTTDTSETVSYRGQETLPRNTTISVSLPQSDNMDPQYVQELVAFLMEERTVRADQNKADSALSNPVTLLGIYILSRSLF